MERFLYLEIVDFLFLGEQRSCDGRGGTQRPVWRVNEPKKTGARSARARTRGQNPLVYHIYIYLGSSVCLSSCHIPVILSYLQNAELFFMF
jgi:hypothetical protein